MTFKIGLLKLLWRQRASYAVLRNYYCWFILSQCWIRLVLFVKVIDQFKAIEELNAVVLNAPWSASLNVDRYSTAAISQFQNISPNKLNKTKIHDAKYSRILTLKLCNCFVSHKLAQSAFYFQSQRSVRIFRQDSNSAGSATQRRGTSVLGVRCVRGKRFRRTIL